MRRCHRLLRCVQELNAHLLSAAWTLTLLQFYHPAFLPLPCARVQVLFYKAPSSVASLSKEIPETSAASAGKGEKQTAEEREIAKSQQ